MMRVMCVRLLFGGLGEGVIYRFSLAFLLGLRGRGRSGVFGEGGMESGEEGRGREGSGRDLYFLEGV